VEAVRSLWGGEKLRKRLDRMRGASPASCLRQYSRSPRRSDLAPAPFASSVAAERYFKHLGVKKSLYCGGVMRDEPGTASIAC
jgi:hypothetical protein